MPTGATAQLDVDGRSTLTGSLTGSGTLTVYTPYVRTDFSGNWSAFTGLINVTTSGTNNFRCKNAAGYPNARLNLASAHLSLQSRLTATNTIPIGELSGVAGSYLSAPIGSSGNDGLPVIWRIGGLNTSANFAGSSYDNVGFIKVGTGAWTWTGANYHTGPNTVSNGTLFVMGNAAAATGPFTVAAAGTLGGNGTVGGAATVHGVLSPGSNSIGTITFTDNLTLAFGSTTVIEIHKAARTQDLVSVGRTFKPGGNLLVTNLVGTLALGDRFKIFNAASFDGAFASMSLPPLPPGWDWNTSQLLTLGELWIVAVNPPVLGQAWVQPDRLQLRRDRRHARRGVSSAGLDQRCPANGLVDRHRHQPVRQRRQLHLHSPDGLVPAVLPSASAVNPNVMLVSLLLALTQFPALSANPVAASPPGAKPTLFLIGDSTVRNCTRGQLGWGDAVAGWSTSPESQSPTRRLAAVADGHVS